MYALAFPESAIIPLDMTAPFDYTLKDTLRQTLPTYLPVVPEPVSGQKEARLPLAGFMLTGKSPGETFWQPVHSADCLGLVDLPASWMLLM
jgi:hypothetical protein